MFYKCPISNSDCLILLSKLQQEVLALSKIININGSDISKICIVQKTCSNWFKPVRNYWLIFIYINTGSQNIIFCPFFAKLSLKTICINVPTYISSITQIFHPFGHKLLNFLQGEWTPIVEKRLGIFTSFDIWTLFYFKISRHCQYAFPKNKVDALIHAALKQSIYNKKNYLKVLFRVLFVLLLCIKVFEMWNRYIMRNVTKERNKMYFSSIYRVHVRLMDWGRCFRRIGIAQLTIECLFGYNYGILWRGCF